MKRVYVLTIRWKGFGTDVYKFSNMHSAIEVAKDAHECNEYIAYMTLKSTPLTSL